MPEYRTRKLVRSTTPGRFSLDDPETGADLHSGDPIDICIGGQWIRGSVEHMVLGRLGYYFVADKTNEVCGLCEGMTVRLVPGKYE